MCTESLVNGVIFLAFYFTSFLILIFKNYYLNAETVLLLERMPRAYLILAAEKHSLRNKKII